jgi:heavy metal sensor kinase
MGKQASERELLLERAKDNRVEEATKLDNDLLARAHNLANQAQMQFTWQRGSNQDYLPLGLLTATLAPNGHITGPLLFCEGHHGSKIGELLFMMAVNRISFVQVEPDNDKYFQINTKWVDWHSRSMGELSFPYDPQVEERMKPFDYFFDDTELAGAYLRRVSIKAPVGRVQHIRLRRRGPRPPEPRNPPPTEKESKPPQTETWDPPPLTFFVQAAGTTTERDQAVAAIDESLQSDLENLEAQSKMALADLRNRLLLISLATFALTVLTGFWLVRLGLLPLNHLSEAVSQVSEKDFRLPVDNRRMPAELKPIVERLTTTLEQLRRAFDREKQAAADISHELRTPLSAMLTTLDLALRKPRSGEEYRELLQDCRLSGQQMSQLVERLLILARIDAGVDNLRPLELDATGLADQCAALVRPLADARGLRLRVHHDKPVLITADPNKLREVVTNLLHNAIQYNRPNGSIELKVGRKNGSLEMIVEDTGIGINSEARTHIFERFYRADPSRHADGLHAGLGLSIVKGYVDLMGGSISVESTEGVGSAFRVQLPIRNGREGPKV